MKMADVLPRDKNDFGAFELEFKEKIDLDRFELDAKGGLNGFWLICTEKEAPDFRRFSGVVLPSYGRIIIDVAPTYAYVAFSEVPLETICGMLNVKRVIKDGEVILRSYP